MKRLRRSPLRRRLLQAAAGAAWAGVAGAARAAPSSPSPSPSPSPSLSPSHSAPPAVAAGRQLPPAAAPEPAPSAARAWRNWSGLQACQPARWLVPADEGELARALPSLPAPLRCVGAGHSFSPLVPTTGTLISLDRLHGVGAVDPQRRSVRVGAGTRLAVLAQALHQQGWALENQPDVDLQTLAGALATATHGTGATLPALHDAVLELRLCTPDGRILRCSRSDEPALFDAARVSLGVLGVVTELTLRVRPRHLLQRRVWLERSETLIDRVAALASTHLHFECYLLPFTGYGAAIVHDPVDAAIDHPPSADEDVLRDLRLLRDWLGRWPRLRRWVAQRLIDPAQREQAVDWSPKLLSTVRPTRFNESEIHLPAAAAARSLRQTLALLERRNEVFFPIEFRFVRADDAWLSPFHARDSASIAVHAAHDEPHDYLWQDLAPLWAPLQGRPHWGKLHGLRAAELAPLYPRWRDFARLRAALDPQGRMLTPALRALLTGADDA